MMMDTLSVYQLRILAAIVEHGSFSAAGRALSLTQPAVSAQVRHLRALSHDVLFLREGGHLVLTEVGRTLYRYAEDVLGTTEALSRQLEDLSRGERDHLIVEGPLSYVAHVLPSTLSRFKLAHPQLRLTVNDAPSHDVIEHVHKGRVDVGFAFSFRLSEETAKAISLGQLFEDEIVVVEAIDAPFSRGKPMGLEDLHKIPFVGLTRGEGRLGARLSQRLTEVGLPPLTLTMQCSTWAGTIRAVAVGVGAAVAFRSVVQSEFVHGTLRALDVPDYHATMSVDLLCSPERRTQRRTALLDELLEFLKAELPSAVESPSEGLAI
jgi:DNA-binding transcriptional LysR family regulator